MSVRSVLLFVTVAVSVGCVLSLSVAIQFQYMLEKVGALLPTREDGQFILLEPGAKVMLIGAWFPLSVNIGYLTYIKLRYGAIVL